MYFDTLCLGKGNVQPVTCKIVMIYKDTSNFQVPELDKQANGSLAKNGRFI